MKNVTFSSIVIVVLYNLQSVVSEQLQNKFLEFIELECNFLFHDIKYAKTIISKRHHSIVTFSPKTLD